jgi:hypothetical protein
MTMAIVNEWMRMHNLTFEEAVNQIEYLMLNRKTACCEQTAKKESYQDDTTF